MLDIQHLQVTTRQGKKLLEDISFFVQSGSIVGLTGESGAGKTTIIKSIMGMLDRQLSINGTLSLNGQDLHKLSFAARRNMCGTTLGFIPQIPMTAFDPRLTIGSQMRETFRYKLGGEKRALDMLAKDCLRRVNLYDIERVWASTPSALSGGMLQRIAFAFQLGLKPKYILADEPTSALDESNSEIILELLLQQKKESGILLVSHDYHALETIADKMIVLHSGKSIYYSSFSEMIHKPQGDWTRQFAAHYKPPQKGDFVWTAL